MCVWRGCSLGSDVRAVFSTEDLGIFPRDVGQVFLFYHSVSGEASLRLARPPSVSEDHVGCVSVIVLFLMAALPFHSLSPPPKKKERKKKQKKLKRKPRFVSLL